MNPNPREKLRAEMAVSPGRVVLAHPLPPTAADAIATLSREKWLHVVADIRVHDGRLVDRYADVWDAVRRPAGVGGAESRRELEDPVRMGAAIVLAGQADAVVVGGPVPSAAARGMRGSILSALCLFWGGTGSSRVAVELCEGQDITPQNLVEAAFAGLKVARRVCRANPSVEFVLGTVTAALGTRRRYQSEETAARARVEEAAETLRARDGSASVAGFPVSGFTAGSADVLVVASGMGDDLRYRLEREFPGGEVVGPLIQGALVPMHRVSPGAAAERIIDEIALMMLGAAGG